MLNRTKGFGGGRGGRAGIVMLGVIAGVGAATLAPLPWQTGAVAAPDAQNAGATYQVDAVHSATIFGIKHLGVGYVYGRFNDITGQFHIDPKNPKDSSVEITIKIESVDTGNEGRDKHLCGPDFFNAPVFPEATFKSTSFKGSGDDLEMTGDLTIHGVTKSVTVPVEFIGEGTDPWGNKRAGFAAEFTIKRSDFGMAYMLEGIGDNIRMIVAIEGAQATEKEE